MMKVMTIGGARCAPDAVRFSWVRVEGRRRGVAVRIGSRVRGLFVMHGKG